MTVPEKLYPREDDRRTIYLQHAVTRPNIQIGAYTMYHDVAHDPREFENRNVLYQYPVNKDRLVIGKFCSVASGAKFLFNAANHAMDALSGYPFPIFWREWGLDPCDVCQAWDNKGDIVVGNDVWIGYEAVILAGVHIGDGAVIGARAVVTKDVAPYSIVGGVPAREIRRRFAPEVVAQLLQTKWWDWPEEKIKSKLPALQKGRWRELA